MRGQEVRKKVARRQGDHEQVLGVRASINNNNKKNATRGWNRTWVPRVMKPAYIQLYYHIFFSLLYCAIAFRAHSIYFWLGAQALALNFG